MTYRLVHGLHIYIMNFHITRQVGYHAISLVEMEVVLYLEIMMSLMEVFSPSMHLYNISNTLYQGNSENFSHPEILHRYSACARYKYLTESLHTCLYVVYIPMHFIVGREPAKNWQNSITNQIVRTHLLVFQM